jgi:small subunit ribosomal protein S3
VWICKGEVYGKRDLSPNVGMSASAAKPGTGPSGARKPMAAKRKKK